MTRRRRAGAKPAAGASRNDRGGLGIIAGRGTMPIEVAETARSAGRRLHVVAIRGAAGPQIEAYPHTWVSIGQVGTMLNALRRAAVRDLVIIGGVERPDLRSTRFDLGTVINLPSLLALMIGGDDSLLSKVVAFFESKGLRVIGAHEVAPQLLAGEGPLGRFAPAQRDLDDIAIGMEVVRSLGRHDVGQAVVVARGHVLAVEAAEGTDAMLDRAGKLKKWRLGIRPPRLGVLVKCAKPGQERRVDLPGIGPETVRRAAAARLSGIAIASGDVLVAEREEVVRLANRDRLFVVGVPSPRRGRASAARSGKA